MQGSRLIKTYNFMHLINNTVFRTNFTTVEKIFIFFTGHILITAFFAEMYILFKDLLDHYCMLLLCSAPFLLCSEGASALGAK